MHSETYPDISWFASLYTCISYFWWNIQLIHKISIKGEILSLIFICLSRFKMSIGIRVFCLSCFLFRSFFSLSPNYFQHSSRAIFIQAFGRCQQLRMCLSTLWCYHYTVGKCHRQLTAQSKQTHTCTGIHGVWFKGLVVCL